MKTGAEQTHPPRVRMAAASRSASAGWYFILAAAGCQSIPSPANKEAYYYPQELQPVPPLRRDAGRSGLGFHAGNDTAFLEGCLIVADDGQFLGLITQTSSPQIPS